MLNPKPQILTLLDHLITSAKDMQEIIEVGRQAIPTGTKFRQMIEDVLAQKAAGKSQSAGQAASFYP